MVRSPIFGDHGQARTPESDYIAQGITAFQYEIMPVSGSWSDVIRAGKALNKGLTNILDTWHKGHLPKDAFAGLEVSAPNVIVSAVKRSEDNTGTVLRLYETDGKETDFTAEGSVLPCALHGRIGPWSVQTWYCKDSSEVWQRMQFTEFPYED